MDNKYLLINLRDSNTQLERDFRTARQNAKELFRNARKHLGLKQSAMAKRLDVTDSWLSAIETSRIKPSLDLMLRLTKCCGL